MSSLNSWVHTRTGRIVLRGVIIAVGFLSVALIISATILIIHWPLTRKHMTKCLEELSRSNVTIGSYHEVFFPAPGFVAENVRFTRNSPPGTPPIAVVRRISANGSWPGMLAFTHTVKEFRAEGLHVFIPSPLPPPLRAGPSELIHTVAQNVIADGTILEIARKGRAKPLRFEFPRLNFQNVATNKPIHFHTLMRNFEPPGNFDVAAVFGPWRKNKHGDTPLSGKFKLTDVNLGHYQGIAGMLSSTGTFDGKLDSVRTRGESTIPDWELTSSRHPVNIHAKFAGTVNGMNGDVVLDSANFRFLETSIQVHGSISGQQGKTVSMDFAANAARLQDLLRIFAKPDPATLNGLIDLSAHVLLPPEHEKFLQAVRLNGDFRINSAQFTRETKQEKLDELSARTRKDKKNNDDSERVPADLSGQVDVRNGVADFSRASFHVPGATAHLKGDYSLITDQIGLSGTIAMQSSLSKAAGGVKRVFLKPLDPFFRKENAGAVIPIRITGTPAKPSFKVALK